jgi:hypothetical protein
MKDSRQYSRTCSCRFCGQPLRDTFVDLGMSPLCESYIAPEQLNHMEPFYPLHAYVCSKCLLVQLDEYVTPENIFGEYAYFSSYSDSWVQHAKKYVDMVVERFSIADTSLVMEVASNDGYLLQHFVTKKVPCLGIEPAANIAQVAIEKGIPTVVRFFGTDAAKDILREHGHADLLLGNNVLAHVPNLNDFVAGMKILLGPRGVITMEFPHLMQLMEQNQFDTIYHEHFSYFSFLTVQEVFRAHGFTLFDVEELRSHGGSLRIFARHAEDPTRRVGSRVTELLESERNKGFDCLESYLGFAEKVKATKRKLLRFLIDAKDCGKTVVGYGAPGKGNTLLNYCGVGTDLLDYTVDRSPYKQGKFTPGARIPILHPSKIQETRPDYVLILPWNLQQEIVDQMGYVREWGAKFVVPIPEVRVLA